jgi:hypothetical protein
LEIFVLLDEFAVVVWQSLPTELPNKKWTKFSRALSYIF